MLLLLVIKHHTEVMPETVPLYCERVRVVRHQDDMSAATISQK